MVHKVLVAVLHIIQELTIVLARGPSSPGVLLLLIIIKKVIQPGHLESLLVKVFWPVLYIHHFT